MKRLTGWSQTWEAIFPSGGWVYEKLVRNVADWFSEWELDLSGLKLESLAAGVKVKSDGSL